MPIIVSGGTSTGTIKHTAPAGLHQAVCVDVIDVGQKQTPWGEKPKIVVRWQLPAKDPDGNRHLVQKWYTKSLHEKAALRGDLEAWRQREFTAQELKAFDVEKLIGANCQVLIVHKKGTDGKTWANVQAITPPSKGQKLGAVGYNREAVASDDPDADNTPVYDETEPPPDIIDEPPF